jgi:hypothetical protein
VRHAFAQLNRATGKMNRRNEPVWRDQEISKYNPVLNCYNPNVDPHLYSLLQIYFARELDKSTQPTT